jgi:hypothetical protein
MINYRTIDQELLDRASVIRKDLDKGERKRI